MHKPFSCLLFDLDGTLVDTLQDLSDAINATLADFSLPSIAPARIYEFIGQGIEHLMEMSLQEIGASIPMADIFPRFITHYTRLNGTKSHIYPGVVDTLTALRAQGYAMACVTNKHGRFARPLLEKSGLMVFFEVLVSGEMPGHKKPYPDSIYLACEKLKKPMEEALLVGDSINDVVAARAAGCAVWCVSYGYESRPMQPDITLQKFSDILPRLEGGAQVKQASV